MKAVFCAGGTGGHIYPAVSVARAMYEKDKDAGITFLTSGKKIESDILEREKFRLIKIKASPFNNRLSSIFSMASGLVQSVLFLWRNRPDVVFSTGGYAALPPVIAAFLLRIPVVIHEQNALPGAANRIASAFAKKIAVSYADSMKYFDDSKTFLTGNPVRKEIIAAEKSDSRSQLGISEDRTVVLVVGGSQGAASVNRAVFDMALSIKQSNIIILHVCGEKDAEKIKKMAADKGIAEENYMVFGYVYEISPLLAAADIVVSRCGATALAEIAVKGLPVVLIPFPFAKDLHQDANAKVFEEKAHVSVIQDASLSGQLLSDIIKGLLSDRSKLAEMSSLVAELGRQDAADRVLRLIYDAI